MIEVDKFGHFLYTVDGMWSDWGHWTPCTRSCEGGTRTRQKLCNSPAPMFGGLLCVGTDSQVDYCNNEPCPSMYYNSLPNNKIFNSTKFKTFADDKINVTKMFKFCLR